MLSDKKINKGCSLRPQRKQKKQIKTVFSRKDAKSAKKCLIPGNAKLKTITSFSQRSQRAQRKKAYKKHPSAKDFGEPATSSVESLSRAAQRARRNTDRRASKIQEPNVKKAHSRNYLTLTGLYAKKSKAYVLWNGEQHNPQKVRKDHGTWA